MSVDTGTRVLTPHDLGALQGLLDRDPVESVLVATRLEGSLADRERVVRSIWGFPGDQPDSVCYFGPNLIPLFADPAATDAFAEVALAKGRMCSSIVGSSDSVARLWDHLEEYWGPARLIRWHQPVMAIATPSRVTPDPYVRPAVREDFDVLFPASVSMYQEEIGASPLADGGKSAYQHRLRQLIDLGRAYVRIDGGRVVFKAELGAVGPRCAQIQGVWVDPALRGRGLGTTGTAAVVNAALAGGHQTVSLYVNDFNEAAVRAYESVGFETVGEFMTVLF